MNCNRCGACCKAFGIVEVASGDNIQDELTLNTELPYRIMKTNDFVCVCLKEDNFCSIYENRPAVCKIVEPGGTICKMAREHLMFTSN